MKRAILVIIFISLVGIVRADTVINDISGWKHPTKDIFKQNNVTIQNIKLQKNNTYPIFYIKLPDDSRLRHEAYFEEFLSDLATANSYWDFELVDQQKSFSVVVKIDKKNKRIQDAIYKNKRSYIKVSTVIKLWKIDNLIKNSFSRSPNYLIQFDSLVQENEVVYMLLHEWFKKDDGSFSTLGWYMINSENGDLYKQNTSENKLELIKNVTNLQ